MVMTKVMMENDMIAEAFLRARDHLMIRHGGAELTKYCCLALTHVRASEERRPGGGNKSLINATHAATSIIQQRLGDCSTVNTWLYEWMISQGMSEAEAGKLTSSYDSVARVQQYRMDWLLALHDEFRGRAVCQHLCTLD